MAQQTAVDWLEEELADNFKLIILNNDYRMMERLFEQAKQMEKEQIEKAYTEGVFSILEWRKEEHYYEETYGTE